MKWFKRYLDGTSLDEYPGGGYLMVVCRGKKYSAVWLSKYPTEKRFLMYKKIMLQAVEDMK